MPKKKKDAALTVAVVLDMSGSMAVIRDKAIDIYNEYLLTLRVKEPDSKIMLTVFNGCETVVSEIEAVGDMEPLTTETYVPNCGTPLYDAIGETVRKLRERVGDGKAILAILTDGQENESKEFSREAIFALIKEREKAGWAVVYLGANQDAYAEGAAMGINVNNISNFSQVKTSADAISGTFMAATTHYARTGQTRGLVSREARAKLEADDED